MRQHELKEGEKHLTLSRAHYLIIPGEPPDAASATDKQTRRGAHQEQEDRAADVVIRLTDLEARGASSLHEVHRDLRIWHNHLDIYDSVVERGAFLWDGLSTHLVTRRRALRRVHRAIELLHQILLQGVADLAQLSNRIRDCVARIEDAADQLHREYDDHLTECHSEQTGLRGALARTGLFERVTQHGHQTLQEADRVKAIYDDLLRTIGYAFDEWRVRESDVVQRLSAALGVFLALMGVVTVLDATVALKPSDSDATIFGGGMIPKNFAVGASWVIGVALLVAVGVLVWVWARSGRLGSGLFRRQYSGRHGDCRGAWQLLKDISTNELDIAAYNCGDNMTDWASLDDNLAARFADLWDHASAMSGMNRHNDLSADIKAQTHRIEQWGLHALLLTERAMRMYSYVLPKLTCLYRACTRLPGSFLAGPGMADGAVPGGSVAARSPSDTPTMIDFNDFALSLKHIGLTWNEAYQLELWLLHRRPQSARHLLALLTNLGLTADIHPPAVRSMLDRIKADLDRDSLHEYPEAFAEDIRCYFERKQYTGWKIVDNDGHHMKATAERNGQTYIIHAWLTRTPNARDLGQFLRGRRHKAILATTGSTRPLTKHAARLIGVQILPMGWSAKAAWSRQRRQSGS